MDINSQIYFTTGEFAKLCNVGKQTLYHYDSIGIFSPEVIDENNYRYYSYQQLEVFGAINMLKDIGMPLKEIKNYLDKRSPKELISLLEKERESVVEKLDKLNKIKTFIDKKIDNTKKCLSDYSENITVKHLPEEKLIITKVLDSSSDKKIYEAFTKHTRNCLSKGINSAYFVGGVLDFDIIKNKNYSTYSYIYTKLYESDTEFSNCVKPSGNYLVGYHKGSYYNTDITYKKMLKYIEDNNLLIDSNFYEEVILDDLAVQGYDNYLLKICIKIQ